MSDLVREEYTVSDLDDLERSIDEMLSLLLRDFPVWIQVNDYTILFEISYILAGYISDLLMSFVH